MVFKTFKRGSRRLAEGIGKEAGKAGRLAKKSVKESFTEMKEERAIRKKAFKAARKTAIISKARKEGRASVRSGGGGFGIPPAMDIVFGAKPKKKKRRDDDFPF